MINDILKMPPPTKETRLAPSAVKLMSGVVTPIGTTIDLTTDDDCVRGWSLYMTSIYDELYNINQESILDNITPENFKAVINSLTPDVIEDIKRKNSPVKDVPADAFGKGVIAAFITTKLIGDNIKQQAEETIETMDDIFPGPEKEKQEENIPEPAAPAKPPIELKKTVPVFEKEKCTTSDVLINSFKESPNAVRRIVIENNIYGETVVIGEIGADSSNIGLKELAEKLSVIKISEEKSLADGKIRPLNGGLIVEISIT